MKKIRMYWNGIRQTLAKIHLVDKFLILFMVVLMVQSAYSLFANQSVSSDIDHIDIVIRTSMAAIFGYFLSVNFICHASPPSNDNALGKATNLSLETQDQSIQSQIGFSESTTNTDIEIGNADFREDVGEKPPHSSRLQIIATASIGLFCLVMLIILRNASMSNADMTAPASAAATVTQFRDFVSGCIGFLIGCPTNARNFK